MLKSVDKKFEEIGFAKTKEDKYGVRYERDLGYIHVLEIIHKKDGRHIVQSYDKHLADSAGIGNVSVGLTYKELILIAKKMRQIGYHR